MFVESGVSTILRNYTGASTFDRLGPDCSLLNAESRRCVLDADETKCGTELSLQGRFTNNALEPALKAFEQIKRLRSTPGSQPLEPISAGDGKISKVKPDSKLVPDLVICNNRYAPVCVGEMKTLWTIESLRDAQQAFDVNDRTNFYGHALGQLFAYMHDYGCQYGFLSTYEETVFFKFQAESATGGSPLLLRSPIYHHTGSPFPLPMGPSDGIERKYQKYSVKQIILCFMLLAGEAPGPGERMRYKTDTVRNWLKDREHESVLGKRAAAPPGGTNKARKQAPAPGGSSSSRYERPYKVLVPPEDAWALRVADTSPKNYEICMPGRGWTSIEVGEIQQDSSGKTYVWKKNPAGVEGRVYVKAS
ncbi:MAG: hypothetical protein Q9159_002622 [Coniocarpon cinnabarinum]